MKVVIQMKKKPITIQENQGRKSSTRQADHCKAKGQRPEREANLKLPRKVKVTAPEANLKLPRKVKVTAPETNLKLPRK